MLLSVLYFRFALGKERETKRTFQELSKCTDAQKIGKVLFTNYAPSHETRELQISAQLRRQYPTANAYVIINDRWAYTNARLVMFQPCFIKEIIK